MATGEIQKLRHQIRDIVGDSEVYNGLAGRTGLSFDAQRAELEGINPRVGAKAEKLRAQAEKAVAELRARADAFEAKQAEVQVLVDQALSIVAAREADPNFNSAPVDEAEEDEDFEDDDFEDFEEEDLGEEEDEEEPSLKDKVKDIL